MSTMKHMTGENDTSMNLMEAMNGIKSEYLESAERTREVPVRKEKKAKVSRPVFVTRLVAAAMALSIVLPNTSASVAFAMQRVPVVGAYFKLVTFRDYSYEDANHSAEVSVNGISIDESQPGMEAASDEVKQQAAKSAEDINKEIQATTDSMIAEFRETLKEEGYSTLDVTSDTVVDNDRWYVLKLSTFQAAGSGYEQHHYYVISKQTGKRVELLDLFKSGVDYRKPISDEIIRQMRAAEKADSSNMYWLDETDDMVDNFTEIAENQEFYINNKDKLVIVFQEGDVAPMYMGVQEFVIPDSVIEGMLAE